jgi:hypothetical protein
MPQATRLFTATNWIVKIATVLFIAVAVILAIGVGITVLAACGVVMIPMPPAMTAGLPVQEILVAGAVVILACALIVGLGAMILVLVGRILGSAIAGDPFVILNANRLNAIGILLLVNEGVGMVTHAFITAFPKQIRDHLDFGFDVSLSGLFVALLVFVLAQIFRHGSEMRAELEGTV